MKKINISILTIAMVGLFSTQAQASFMVTANSSIAEVSGSVNNFVTSKNDGYSDGVAYSSTIIPLNVSSGFYSGKANISTAAAFSGTELELNIAETVNGYNISGSNASFAMTEVGSLDDEDATAFGNAAADLAFSLSTSYNYLFSSELFYALGSGESEVELINTTTNTIVFSETVNGGFLELDFLGLLAAGDYTLYLGALSEATGGNFATADLEYNLQLTSVPLPAGLPLLLSGLAALGFKRRMDKST